MVCETADLVMLNGKVATVDPAFSFCQAVAVKDGWIINVGANDEIRGHIGKRTRVLDLAGKVVLPGAHDSHMHAAHTGLFLSPKAIDIKYPTVKSIRELNEKLKAAVREKKPGEWIFGLGWNSALLEECALENNRTPNRWDFDAATPDHPIALFDYAAHAVVVNGKALEIAGISKETPDLRREYGGFDRDPQTGEPNGHFYEWGAMQFIGRHMPQLSEEELEACIVRVQRHLNQNGVTSHADILGVGGESLFFGTWGSKVIEVYERMAREGKLTARVSINLMVGLDGVQGCDAIKNGLRQTVLPQWSDRNWVKADAVKIFGDGAPSVTEGYGAFFGDTPEEQRQELVDSIVEVHRQGWQAAVHATGNLAADAVIEGCVRAQQKYPREAPRHFIVHGDWLTEERAKTAARYKIGLAAQPSAGYIVLDTLVKLFGEERASRFFSLQALTDAGVNVSGGSDSNIFDPNWRLGLQFAVTRTTMQGHRYAPERASNLEDAIRMYTINGAYQEHMEQVRGSIEVNKAADFQVLGEDIFQTKPENISKILVVMTICNGKIVYEA